MRCGLAGGQDHLTAVFLKLTGGAGLQEIDEVVRRTRRSPFCSFRSCGRCGIVRGDGSAAICCEQASWRHRARRLRCLFIGAYWLTTKLAAFEEFGDYLLRLGLSWLFLTFLGFLAFSGVVASLSTFFLSEDLRLLVAAPIPRGRLFLARFTRTVGQSSWMVAMFLTPVLLSWARAMRALHLLRSRRPATVVPFATIPVALGAGATLLLVNVLPARRARDVLMLVSLLLAAALVLILRFIEPERLLRVESLPDIADFFANLQSPVMPLLPSFWAGALRGAPGRTRSAPRSGPWTTALACTVLLGAARSALALCRGTAGRRSPRRLVSTSCAPIDAVARALPLSTVRRELSSGCEGLPPGRESVAAAPAALRARASLSLQLPHARPRVHSATSGF